MASARLWSLVTVLSAGIACGGDGGTEPKSPRSCTVPVGAIAIGQTVAGTLTTSSCKISDGSYADPWTMQVPALATLTIDLGSVDFDAFLFVRDASGNLVVEDDDSGPDFDARIIHTFAAGNYVVYANAYDADEVGGYTLTVTAPPPP